jgi:holo-[acyl-carrier protein] synthase
MLSAGVDIIEIARVRRAIARWGERFLTKVYTPAEVAFCRGRVPELAVRFAAKEAVSKALGTGIIGPGGIPWREIEILPDRRGKPLVYLHGEAKQRAEELGFGELAISLSHAREFAVAFVVGASADGLPREEREKWYAQITVWLAIPKP